MSVVGNILEQEDELKGLSNDRLLQEIEVPSGLFAPFLPPSEMQRRNEMRERYEASQEQPSNTIVEQIVAESMGGISPIGEEGYPPVSPMEMASQTMGSPIPTDLTSQVPVVAAAGAFPDGAMAIEDSGLGGMGGFTEPPMEPQMEQFPQMVAGGGVVGMQAGSQVPTNYRDFVIGESIIKNRGEDLSMYTLDEIEEIGRTGENPLPWYTRASGSDAPIWENRYKNLQLGEDRTFAPPTPQQETPYWQEEDYAPPLDYLDVLQGQSLSPEIEFEQATGRDIDAPTRWEEAGDRFNQLVGDEERYPYRHLDPEFRSRMPFGERAALTLREGFKEIGDVTRTLGPTVGEAVLDAATVGISGDPSDPELQRQQALDAVIEGGGAVIEDIGEGGQQPEIQALLGLGEDALQASGDAVRDFEWSDIERAGQRVMDYFDSGYESPVAGGQQGVLEGVGRGALDVTKEGLGRLGDWWKEGYGRDIGSDQGSLRDTFGEVVMALQHPDAAPESVREAELQTEPDEAEAEGLVGGSITRPPASVPDGLDIPRYDLGGGGGYSNAMAEDHQRRIEEISVSAEEDEATAMKEIASLITKTQDDARGEAFDAFMMEFGAGVAGGDIPGGIQRGTQAIGDIKKDARDAIRALDATRLSRYFEGSKEELERAIALANVDANFATILVNAAIERGRGQRAQMSLIGDLLRYYESNMMGLEGYDDPSSIPALAQRQASQMFDQNLPASVFNVNAGRITSGN